MKRKDLAEQLAADANLPAGDAADRLDDLLHDVLKSLKSQGPPPPRNNALHRLIEEAGQQPAPVRRARS